MLLIAIKPCFANAILEGKKIYEFRRRLPKEDVDTVLLYASSPVRRVVGYAHVDGTLTMPLTVLWERTKDGAGITKEYFEKYFANKKSGSALILSSPVKLLHPLELEDIGVKKAPQSFMYVEEKVLEVIKNLDGHYESD